MNTYHQHPWLRAVFLVGVGMLFTHELDAMTHAEWRVLPLTSWLAPDMGRLTFVVLHVPIFALVLGWLTSQVPGRMIKAQEPKATPRPRLGSKRSERHQRGRGPVACLQAQPVLASAKEGKRAAEFWVALFLVVHATLHLVFSSHADYTFEGILSNTLIFGSAACGAAYLICVWRGSRYLGERP